MWCPIFAIEGIAWSKKVSAQGGIKPPSSLSLFSLIRLLVLWYMAAVWMLRSDIFCKEIGKHDGFECARSLSSPWDRAGGDDFCIPMMGLRHGRPSIAPSWLHLTARTDIRWTILYLNDACSAESNLEQSKGHPHSNHIHVYRWKLFSCAIWSRRRAQLVICRPPFYLLNHTLYDFDLMLAHAITFFRGTC